MPADELEQPLRRVLAQVLSIPLDAVGAELTVKTCATWTSLRHLMLISQLETTFGVRFTNQEIEQLTSYDAIRAAVAEHRPIGD